MKNYELVKDKNVEMTGTHFVNNLEGVWCHWCADSRHKKHRGRPKIIIYDSYGNEIWRSTQVICT